MIIFTSIIINPEVSLQGREWPRSQDSIRRRQVQPGGVWFLPSQVPDCCGLNGKCPLQAHVYGHLVGSVSEHHQQKEL